MALGQQLPILVIVSLLLTAYSLPMFSRRWNLAGGYLAVVALVVALGGALAATGLVLTTGPFTYQVGGWPAPWGIQLAINQLSTLMLLIVLGVAIPICVYTLADIRNEVPDQGSTWFFTLYLLLVAAMAGIALTNDLFNLFVFIEVAGISACALVAAKGSGRATEAAIRYLILASIGSGFILLATGLLYMITGNLNMGYIAAELAQTASLYPHVTWAALVFFVVGFAIKGALFPAHIWLPDAHSWAPSFASAMLSGLVVKIYLFALAKILFLVFGQYILTAFLIPEVLAFMGSLGIIAGSIFALSQRDIKRILAYSTVAQVGYIALGFGLNNSLGLTAALLHILNHAVIKSCLFLATGNIIHATGTRNISAFTGLGKQMPWTMGAFTLASLSLIGVPLLNGFITKFYLVQASLAARQPLFLVVIVVSTLLTAAYLIPLVRSAYFDAIPAVGLVTKEEASPVTLIPTISLAALVIVLGLAPGLPLTLVEPAVAILLAS